PFKVDATSAASSDMASYFFHIVNKDKFIFIGLTLNNFAFAKSLHAITDTVKHAQAGDGNLEGCFSCPIKQHRCRYQIRTFLSKDFVERFILIGWMLMGVVIVNELAHKSIVELSQARSLRHGSKTLRQVNYNVALNPP